ncbi:hypothetical protein PIIN_06484 [Serendipita indica DSM 11827]|uniref:Uncharacterized protein n=1 Tax=Serendipita indica (strain DSM 11827) TaxID=1109443 RepID=G4TMK4_SERID|nr:hypothetical protein PIIN_06484 [Serendipita indica DSM 11827]
MERTSLRTPTSSRPLTPESPLKHILSSSEHSLQYDDDLTNALAALRNFSSRAATPLELTCCCENPDCESLHAWKDAVAKLERELVLSAEVGQALLHRHEAHLRAQDSIRETADRNAQLYSDAREKVAKITAANNQLVAKMSLLVKENTVLEKRLTQTLLNSEIAEASNRTLLHEVQESRSTIAKLSAQSARSVGWEAKLNTLQQERDDLREEKRAEASRARTAEAKVAALSEKCARLQAELYGLREERENTRPSKVTLSDEILRDARLRLDSLQLALSQTTRSEDTELSRVLGELVSENEALKHDNAELQNLLSDSREEVKQLREEVEETKVTNAVFQDRIAEESHILPLRHDLSPNHRKRESWASTASAPLPVSPHRNDGFLSPRLPLGRMRTSSHSHAGHRRTATQVRRPTLETPDERAAVDASSANESDASRMSHSPVPSTAGSRRTSISRHSHTPSTYSVDMDASNQPDDAVLSPPKGRKKLMLLTRSRGVQTDPITILPISPRPASLLDEPTPSGSHSETSSFHEGRVSQMSILLDKVSALLNRMTQADVPTLTNRLKRQHILGADVGHISRSTISSILNEVSGLRNHFRSILDDERSATVISRKEFRGLLKSYSDLFQELGSLRATVNEVVLNPGIANKLREEALEPEESKGKVETAKGGALGGWIAPLSKFWAGAPSNAADPKATTQANPTALIRAGSSRNRLQPPKIAPKIAAAVSASTTTVNVEFTNAGIRRAISTTPDPVSSPSPPVPKPSTATSPLAQPRPQLRGIFAGSSGGTSTRLVAERQTSVGIGTASSSRLEQAKLRAPRRATQDPEFPKGEPARRYSRAVDAVVDQHAVDEDEEDDEYPGDLLQRTLRPRGLSDSSVHSSMIPHGPPVSRLLTPAGLALSSPTVDAPATGAIAGVASALGGVVGWLEKDPVLQSFSRRVQGLRFPTGSNQMKTQDLPDSDQPPNTSKQPENDGISSSQGATPTTLSKTLPISPSLSPPKPIPEHLSSRTGLLRRNDSRSPPRKSSPRGSPRLGVDTIRAGSFRSGGILPGMRARAGPVSQIVIEREDTTSPRETRRSAVSGLDSPVGHLTQSDRY